MFNSSFKLTNILLIMLCLLSCITDNIHTEKDLPEIQWNFINYNQIKNELFVQIQITSNDSIKLVEIEVKSPNYNSYFNLNDNGTNGDLIKNNGIYSTIINQTFPYEEYILKYNVHFLNGTEFDSDTTITFDEEISPEFIEIIFWEVNDLGESSKFDPDTTPFMVDNEKYKYLYFQTKINDPNGLDDIQYVRYQINVEGMYANDSCQYSPESGFLSYPQWYLTYKEDADTNFIFDINNQYLNEPGIPIKPIQDCGRVGLSTFRFTVSDFTFSPVTQEITIEFDN